MPTNAAASLPALHRGHSVRRTRLLTRFAGSVDRPIVVVSGPAGWGKSTFAAQIFDADDRAQAFLRLAPHDDDPVVLAGRIVGALESLGRTSTATRAPMSPLEPWFSAVLLPALGQQAVSRERPYLFVIDGVHVVRNPQCWDLLVAVADAVPVGSTLLLLTRNGVPERLARARAEGRLEEIGPVDLAFDVDEAAQLLGTLDLGLPAPDVAALVGHTEGWAVGLYLSALAMKRAGVTAFDPLHPAPRGSDAYVLDYVHTEVLGPLTPDERSFLVRTSIVVELQSDVCNAIAGRDDSAAVLAQLSRRSQLVVPVDDDRFRCHQLLREAVQADLENGEPGLLPVLHARAARWYADHGDLDAAIRHATAAGDVPLVADLVWSGIVGCVGSGRPERLVVWLGGLSERQISCNRWLSLASAWSAMQAGKPDLTGRWVLASRAHAGADWRVRMRTDDFAASLAVLEAVVGAGGLEDSVSLCDGALEGLPADSGFRAAAAFIRGVSQALLRRPEESRLSLEEAVAVARALDVPIIESDALSWQGAQDVLRGDSARGSELIRKATRVITANHLERLATSAHSVSAQALLLALTHSEDAPASLATARRLTAMVPEIAPWFAVCGRLVQARAAVLLGNGALARTLIVDARVAMTPDLRSSMAQDLLESTVASLQTLTRDGRSGAALTSAEMRILQFLPSHLSFPMIGEHVFLSQNTVKTHALSIYRKFGVASRSEAVTVAQSLGLVEGPARP